MRNLNYRKDVFSYKTNGFTPFPLVPNTKIPYAHVKMEEVEYSEWHENDNIGIFPGSPNGLVVIDCDNETSKTTVPARLKELNLFDTATIVRTPTKNGLHIWLKCPDVPSNVQTNYHLKDSIGAGEFRLHRTAYVVAPSSVLSTGEYIFEQGGIDWFANQPEVKWDSLTWLLPHKENETTSDKLERGSFADTEPLPLPVRLIYRDKESRKSLKLLRRLENIERNTHVKWEHIDRSTGEVKDEYKSVSHAEAAVIMGLILCGWSYEQIARVFEDIQPAHWSHYTLDTRDTYVLETYNNAIRKLSGEGKHQEITELYHYAQSLPWPGKSGANDLKVLLAILSNAWQWNTFQPKASVRDISEHASTSSHDAIRRAKTSLQNSHLIRILRTDPGGTSWFDITPLIENKSVNNITINNQTQTEIYGKDIDTSPAVAEVWGQRFLGSSAQLVYIHLTDTPIDVKNLMLLTKKSRNTVIATLRKLSEMGLANKVEKGCWVRGDANLEDVAKELGGIERADKRRWKHKQEKKSYHEQQRMYMMQEAKKNNEKAE